MIPRCYEPPRDNITRRRHAQCYNAFVVGGGNNGGNVMPDKLEKRVERLEADVADIKSNIAILTTRSESFATKSDVLEIREGLRLEMADLRQSLRSEMADLRQCLKSDMADLRQSLKVEMADHRTEIQKAFTSQTWQLASIIVSAMAALVAIMVAIK